MMIYIAFGLVGHILCVQTALPTITVSTDNAVITKSCRIVIPPGTVIEDADNNGVIRIDASDITVEFAPGSVLRGSPDDRPPDEYRGYGIRITGQRDVTIRGARISGFWCGLWATDADGLVLEEIDASDNRRARLKSTPTAEDGSDWLSPHYNDDHEWLKRYGAALYVERSKGITIRACKVWHGQNALLLDRVSASKIYDNDFSFNSGWGIGLWRSSHNVISRNAIDFCVRGYSHGVYNRGQDSAGILMFEQNCDNWIVENSATHGGDCFFGFAGREALGEGGTHPPEWYRRRGNNNNVLLANDFSYAPAHGIEMTFSFGNQFVANRLVGNAICGVWGGYSQDTLIADNTFADNGEMGYGLERGGVNIEHGKHNRIVHNTFTGEKCGVHLWWDPDGGFAKRPWALANGTESTDNLIADNTFTREQVVFHFRGKSDVTIGANTIRAAGSEMMADKEVRVIKKPDLHAPEVRVPPHPVFGSTHPVGARPELRGRQNIIMTAWGPWDHTSPLIRKTADTGAAARYELYKLDGPLDLKLLDAQPGLELARHVAAPAGAAGAFEVRARGTGVFPYRVRVRADDFERAVSGTLIATTWRATFFKWSKDVDPRKNPAGWRKLADSDTAVRAAVRQLSFKYGFGGPSEQKISPAVTQAKLGGDHFGMIARTRLPLPAGKWQFATLSDDGVRVTVDGRPVIDNWTWHGPTRDTGTFELTEPGTVEIIVEHFEIDGFAVLDLQITRQRQRKQEQDRCRADPDTRPAH